MTRPLSYQKHGMFAAILLALVLCASLLCLWLLPDRLSRNPHRIAVIRQDGVLLYSIDLSGVAAPYDITIQGENGAYNILHVEQGRIRITQASCPDKLCMKLELTDDSLLPVICLPNRVVIERDLQATDPLLDTITY